MAGALNPSSPWAHRICSSSINHGTFPTTRIPLRNMLHGRKRVSNTQNRVIWLSSCSACSPSVPSPGVSARAAVAQQPAKDTLTAPAKAALGSSGRATGDSKRVLRLRFRSDREKFCKQLACRHSLCFAPCLAGYKGVSCSEMDTLH